MYDLQGTPVLLLFFKLIEQEGVEGSITSPFAQAQC